MDKELVASINVGITVTMNRDKDTKGTVVYKEAADTPLERRTFPTIYVQKGALTDPPPEQLEVTIRAL